MSGIDRNSHSAHSHFHAHDNIHDHAHAQTHDPTHENDDSEPRPHSHTHSHTQTKAIINRLSRAIGHMESVKRMVEDGRDCSEVLIQLAAVRSAIVNTAKLILKDHIENCVVDAVESKDHAALDELNKAIERFL